MKIRDIHALIGGDIVNESPTLTVSSVQPLDTATETDIVFIFNSNPPPIQTNAKIIVLKKECKSFKGMQIIHSQPRLAMAITLQHLYPNQTVGLIQTINKHTDIHPSVELREPVGIDAFVSIGKHSTIGSNTKINPNASIGCHCHIGNNVIIGSNVSIYDHTIIGDNVTIHSNAVIGSDGFGFEKNNETWEKIPHIGKVVIGNNVDIGSHCTINRGCLTDTIISDGVKLDNHVQISHNCSVGENTIIAGASMIAGSSSIGKSCIIAGNVGIKDNIDIGDGVIIFARAGVTKSIPNHQRISGYPAIDHKLNLKKEAYLNGLFKSNN